MRALLIGMALLAACACNQHNPLVDTPVSPTTVAPVSSAPPVASGPIQPNVATVNLTHSAVQAGSSLRGVVSLYTRAPEGGATVTLSSGDPAVIVPATVTFPEGERTADFTVTTRLVPDDRHLLITAGEQGRSAVAMLSVWSDLPNHFAWFSDADELIGEGGFSRMAPLDAEIFTACDGNKVRIEAGGPEDPWTMVFTAPAGSPLRPGTYDGITHLEAGDGTAGMSISGRGRSCGAMNGRFIIREIDLQNDRVNRFRVSFEQQCTNGDLQGWLQGELRVTGARSASDAGCQR